MRPALVLLTQAFEKFNRISKKAMDFGVGEPLYPSEIHMVCSVAMGGPKSITQLAESFGTTKGATSQMVAKLQKKGFLEKRRDPEKQSRMLVSATEKGAVAHKHHLAFHAEHDRDFFNFIANLDEEQYQLFDTLCTRMDLWMEGYLNPVHTAKE